MNKFIAKFTEDQNSCAMTNPVSHVCLPMVNLLLGKTGESLAKCARRSLHFGKISFLKSWKKKEICRWICTNFCILGQATCAENASMPMINWCRRLKKLLLRFIAENVKIYTVYSLDIISVRESAHLPLRKCYLNIVIILQLLLLLYHLPLYIIIIILIILINIDYKGAM